MRIIVEVMVGLGHRKRNVSTKYLFHFKIWFDFKISVNDVMDVGADFICVCFITKPRCSVRVTSIIWKEVCQKVIICC